MRVSTAAHENPEGYDAKSPVAVFEVGSSTTRDFDRIRKVEEYEAVTSMRHVVIIEPKFIGVIPAFRDFAEAARKTEL